MDLKYHLVHQLHQHQMQGYFQLHLQQLLHHRHQNQNFLKVKQEFDLFHLDFLEEDLLEEYFQIHQL